MKRCATWILCLGLALSVAAPARALSLLRDADIEHALTRLAAPVLQAAGLSPAQVRILVVDDGSLNAFVADTRHILLHSGLILKLDTARSLQAVIAHEAAHIANGHISRRAANMQNARTAAGLGLIMAGAAAAAGGNQAAFGLALGTQSAAMRNFLAHTRAEEAAADQSSMRYLARAGIDPRGAVEVMQIFRGQEALSVGRQDPYMLTHPLSRDRLRALEGLAASIGQPASPDGTAQYWFARAKGKLSAFTRNPGWTLRRAGEGPTADIAAMREAVAHHKQSDLRRALPAIDRAIAARGGRDPYLIELKGQILLEGRQPQAAIAAYRQAAALAPREPLIQGGLGRALLAAGDHRGALAALEQARANDGQDPRILRDLAVAYARTGQTGLASVVTAERYALSGRLGDAAIHATRAEALLPQGTPGWRRAMDVLSAADAAR